MSRLLAGQLLLDPVTPPRPGWIRIQGGVIVEVGDGKPPVAPEPGDPDHIICPGFVDAHIHLPQIDSIGFDRPDLMTWLDTVIYPAEAAWQDEKFAADQIDDAHRRMLNAGTLSYAGYLTSHATGLEGMAAVHSRCPLNALVGPCLMDRNAPRTLLREPPPLPRDVLRRRISVNPRFAIACSDELLGRAAVLAREGRFIQTHLAEQRDECALVAKRFPGMSYTAVYDWFGLLGAQTLLAHAVHLEEGDWRVIAERESVVVHCPTANTFLGSGLFDFASARQHGIRLALGSDVAAGPDLAMPRVARAMIEVAKLRQLTIDPEAIVPTPAEAWWMITEGNAQALGIENGGQIAAGAPADLLVLDPPLARDENLVPRLLYTWEDTMIVRRFVAGQEPDARAATRTTYRA